MMSPRGDLQVGVNNSGRAQLVLIRWCERLIITTITHTHTLLPLHGVGDGEGQRMR